MGWKADAGQVLKPNRCGAKYVDVARQETYDAFALTGGGVLVLHSRSRRLRFGSAAVDLLARPSVEIIDCVGNDLATETTPLRSGAIDPFAFEGALPNGEITRGIRRP